jgi:putative sigma-54 modulation protein
MQVIFSTRGITISKAYKDALTRKLAKLEPLLPILETKAVLSREKHRRMAALTLVTKRRIFRAKETADDLAAAVDMAVDALARQVREMKDRVKNRKARHARRPGPSPRAGEAPSLDVFVRRVILKPMSIDEAAAELAREREDFVVFTDASTDAVNVLYRRRDGGLGLIAPGP